MITAIENATQAETEQADVASLPDEELLLGYQRTGDRDLFEQLVKRYERPLFSYLQRYLGNAELAEDAFQGTFLQVHLRCDRFEPGRKVRPWLYTVATNQAIDAQRRNKRHCLVSLDRVGPPKPADTGKLIDLLVSGEPDPTAEAERDERGRWVRQTVEQLAEHLRQVVVLVYYQGLKYREAAEVLSIPVGTVKSRLHAAILKMNEAWNDTHLPQQ